MIPKTALIYAGALSRFCYGEEHPFKPRRYRFAYELMEAYGLTGGGLETISDFHSVGEEELLAFHSADYLDRLKEFSRATTPRADFRYSLGDAENPVFPGMYDWALLGTSATAEAARLVLQEGYGSVFHLGGGYHHAHRARAAGFSYLNDAVIAINRLLAAGKRVAYLDIDAHHGDGVQEAFYDSDQVLTISLHQSGIYFFPGTGFEHETGTGAGTGYSVNVPFLEHSDDLLFIKAFEEVALPLISSFSPDILVTQLGVDTFRSDPLSLLEITTRGYTHIIGRLRDLRLPWIATAGGGYDNFNTARAWTLVWAIMNGIALPPALPDSFTAADSDGPVPHGMLLDPPHRAEETARLRARQALDGSIGFILRNAFPFSRGRP